jgi:hypothetical protein
MAGAISNDRKQGARVRRLLLDEIERLFDTDPLKLSERETETKRELLLRMSSNTLPRLHEVAGEDGGPITVQIINYGNDKGSVQVHT